MIDSRQDGLKEIGFGVRKYPGELRSIRIRSKAHTESVAHLGGGQESPILSDPHRVG
jgi:hypothetical protein